MNFPKEVSTLLKQPEFMVLSTLRQDGTIQMSVVWYEFKDDVFHVSVTTDRAKYKNIKRNPNVTFVVVNKANPYQFVQIRGNATISNEKTPEAYALTDRLSDHYTGDPIFQRDPEHKQNRVIVTITPLAYTTNGF